MKIVHVIPFFAPAWGYGGPVRVSYELAKYSAKAGHQVSVLTTDAYDHTRRIDQVCEEIDKVKVFRAKNLSNRLAKNYNLFLPKGFSELCQENIKNADVVHLHSFYHFLNVIAVRYCRKYNIPYLIHLHELPVAEPMFGKVIIKKAFNILWGRKILKNATKILALTKSERERVITAYPFLEGKVEILPNPIESTKKTRKIPNLRKKYGYLAKDKILLSLSRLSNLKRVDKIVLGLGEVLKKDPSYRLIIAGPDEMGNLAKLKALSNKLGIADKIKFTGAVAGKKKEELFELADLYVLLADYESFSITTLEAIDHKVLPILNQNVGLAKDLETMKTAVILKDDAPDKFARAVLKAYDNRISYRKNMPPVIGKFSIQNILSRLLTIYQESV